MKKDCVQTRKALRRYLHGHVFAPERMRIERHLKACPHCATEFQSLRRVDETTQFLRDITPPEGVVQRMKSGVTRLGAVKKVLYRPLWVLTGAAVCFAAYFGVIVPYLSEQEREWQELIAPAAPAAATAVPDAPKEAAVPRTPAPPAAAKKEEPPLVVTITVDDAPASLSRINEVMRGHGELRTARFSDAVREVTAQLTSKELLTFFNRIQGVGKASYSREQLERFPSAHSFPVVLKLSISPRPVRRTPETAVQSRETDREQRPAAGAAQGPAEPAAPKAAEGAPAAR